MPYHEDHDSHGSGPSLLKLQNTILEMIARGDDLGATCVRLCLEVEGLLPGVACSVLSVDRGGLLHPLAGPSLPDVYSEALDGLPIGPDTGSCGTAAFLGTEVIAEDIASDRRWANFRSLALPHGLKACWSIPIINAQGTAVGTFGIYFFLPRGPTPREQAVVRNCTHLCLIAIDRDQRLKEHERRAWSDALTGLPNRAAFNAELQKLDCQAPGSWALFVIDLDNLKVVNDTFGHHAGDALLKSASDRIARIANPNRTFRVGGDEFTIIIKAEEALRNLDLMAQAILSELATPSDCSGHSIVPRATIGGAVLSQNELTVEHVRTNADFALYHAKETGRGGFVRYWPGLGSTMTRRLGAIRDVNAALRDDRIDAYYQPIFRLDTREVVGLEALCRMRIGKEIISAASFHEATIDAYVATALTARMMALVAADVRKWLDMGIPFQHVGINVSSADLSGGTIDRILTSAFGNEGVPLKHVILEVTETVYMGDEDQTVQNAIKALRRKGIRVALDDFGTGFASLTHLLTFPVDIIKIDKSFITKLTIDSISMTIVESLIRISQKMNIRIIAEGVETEGQARLLQDAGCTLAQGYLYSHAINRHEMTSLLLKRAQFLNGRAAPISGFIGPR